MTIKNSSVGTDIQTACNSFTWINGRTYTASNSTSTQTVSNANGCDSVITLDLTLTYINTALTQSATSISSNQSGATSYKWLDCGNNFAPIAGETNFSYSPSSNGTYAVEITVASCVDTSLCVTYAAQTNGVNENSPLVLKVSPNPFNDILYVKRINLNSASVQLFDISGKEYAKSITISENSINTSNLSKGIYILNVNGVSTKLVKL